MKLVVMLAASALLVVVATAFAVDKPSLKVGDKAPEFKLQGSDGKEYTLGQFTGKQAVVISWFPKAFTGGWTAECDSLRDGEIKEEYDVALLGGSKYHVGKRDSGSGLRKFDVVYFAACVDDVDTVKRFAKDLKLDFPVLADSDKTVAKAYGVLSDRGFANRWTFYIGKNGVIQFIDQKVSAKDHGKDVAKKLEELGVPKK